MPFLEAFLVGTIVGERLELSRFAPPSRWKQSAFVGAIGVLTLGCLAAGLGVDGGWTMLGLGLLAVAAWLGTFDIARRTVRLRGVTCFIALCLLSGYVWIAVAGVWWAVGGDMSGGLGWDAALHAVFVGFALAVVFGHTHLVAPAVLGLAVPYRAWFFGHLGVLHLSLLVRIAGDVAGDVGLRRLGAAGNGLALAVFPAGTVAAVRLGEAGAPATVSADEMIEVARR